MSATKLPWHHSRFWLGDSPNLDFSGPEGLLNLSNIRRTISNFVFILTGKDIPVRFAERGKSKTDGSVIYIGNALSNGEVDVTVGLVLHESMHIVHSDFAYLKTLWGRIPARVYVAGGQFPKKEIESMVKLMINIVEDRYIDEKAIVACPGYKGYYDSLYEKYVKNETVSEVLKSNSYRKRTWESYKYRIMCLPNTDSDLDALPELRKISELLTVENLMEQKTFRDRVDLAIKILLLILEDLEVEESNSEGDTSGNPNEEQKECSEEGEDTADEYEKFINRTPDPMELSEGEMRQMEDLEQKCQGSCMVGGSGIPRVSCVVIRSIDEKILESPTFPYRDSSALMAASGKSLPDEYVYGGVKLGIELGKRLQIRGEARVTKFGHQPSGKFDKKRVSDLGFGGENVFYRLTTDNYKKAHAHISIDASSSMEGDKWRKTIKVVIAVAKAATLIPNLEVVISLRSGNQVGDSKEERPYVVVLYDSRVDQLRKLINLLPKIHPHGSTPEGLVFPVITSLLPPPSPDLNRYFINLSDGLPTFGSQNGSIYAGGVAYAHGRRQIELMKSQGIHILSYYVDDGVSAERAEIMRAFRLMYGLDAKFINVTDLVDIAYTLNKRFLQKED